MPLDREVIRQIREFDEHDLRRLMIFVRGLLVQRGVQLPEVVPARASQTKRVGYRLEGVKCGKRGCTRCPHGPYWYAYWRESGKLRSKYIGKDLPPGVSQEVDGSP